MSTSQHSDLVAAIHPVDSLTPGERRQLYQLFELYFEGARFDAFERDLLEKESVVLLLDQHAGRISGFTTLCQFTIMLDGRRVTAFFSGDTIVDEVCRRETALGRLWLQSIFSESREISTGPVYWFLISSGYKTYRVLPTLFKTFYPTFSAPTPSQEKRIIDSLAMSRYGDGYDATSGVIRLPNPTPLREGVAEITPARSRDPHVRFFLSANTGHRQGDELACLAEICLANLTPIGRRLLGSDLMEACKG